MGAGREPGPVRLFSRQKKGTHPPHRCIRASSEAGRVGGAGGPAGCGGHRWTRGHGGAGLGASSSSSRRGSARFGSASAGAAGAGRCGQSGRAAAMAPRLLAALLGKGEGCPLPPGAGGIPRAPPALGYPGLGDPRLLARPSLAAALHPHRKEPDAAARTNVASANTITSALQTGVRSAEDKWFGQGDFAAESERGL